MLFSLLLTTQLVSATPCLQVPEKEWQTLREQLPEAQSVTPALINTLYTCLASSDPRLRDQTGYQLFSDLLREDRVPATERQALWHRLNRDINNQVNDPLQVFLPFAILVYVEVLRTDRITPWMTFTQRQDSVDTLVKAIKATDDYRGFSKDVGWRHQIAHLSDAVLQMAVNDKVLSAQKKQLARAIMSQISPSSHAYIHGESSRMARAVGFLMLDPDLTEAFWSASFLLLSEPKSVTDWDKVFNHEAGLNERHNLRLFLYELLALLALTEQPHVVPLRQLAQNLLKQL